jgi:hypothetical protein
VGSFTLSLQRSDHARERLAVSGARSRTVFVAFVPDALELVEGVLDQTIQVGGLRFSGPIDSLGIASHMESNCRRVFGPISVGSLFQGGLSSGAERTLSGRFLIRGKGGDAYPGGRHRRFAVSQVNHSVPAGVSYNVARRRPWSDKPSAPIGLKKSSAKAVWV